MHKTLWFDIDNTPHVNFFKPLVNRLSSKYNTVFSVKDFAETESLFKMHIGKEYYLVGNYKGGNKIAKVIGAAERTFQLLRVIPKFDIKISIGGDSANLCAKIKRKKTITFDDNEKAPNWRYSWLSDFAFWPACVNHTTLIKQGFKEHKLYRYNGFKENIYIADYNPDGNFLESLPFRDYVVVRAENSKANYVNNRSSIVPRLLRLLVNKGYNIVYLPRYSDDIKHVDGVPGIFVPKSPLNGLDLCYYATAVLSGAGTLTREAACLGVPSVSFYAGSELLDVDKEMIKNGDLYHTRDPHQILSYVLKGVRREFTVSNSKSVRDDVFFQLEKVIEKLLYD